MPFLRKSECHQESNEHQTQSRTRELDNCDDLHRGRGVHLIQLRYRVGTKCGNFCQHWHAEPRCEVFPRLKMHSYLFVCSRSPTSLDFTNIADNDGRNKVWPECDFTSEHQRYPSESIRSLGRQILLFFPSGWVFGCDDVSLFWRWQSLSSSDDCLPIDRVVKISRTTVLKRSHTLQKKLW